MDSRVDERFTTTPDYTYISEHPNFEFKYHEEEYIRIEMIPNPRVYLPVNWEKDYSIYQ